MQMKRIQRPSICKINDESNGEAFSQLQQHFVKINNLSDDVLVQILLYGDRNFPNEINKIILELTLDFIHKTGRFD